VDILSKREHFYRQYFLQQNIATNLPKYLLCAPTNPVLMELKNAYPFIDPSTFSSEFSREHFYQNLNFVRFNLIKDLMALLSSSPINGSGVSNYLFFYLFGTETSTKVSRNIELYKNQYRPMRKGVTNMIRLHATGAIAMPIEIRMHILASSRDVIHS
jgi:hypothetical protein